MLYVHGLLNSKIDNDAFGFVFSYVSCVGWSICLDIEV